MKQSSIEKLSKIYSALYDRGDNEGMALIKDIIRAEAIIPAKCSKFDIYKYVSDDSLRPALGGVFHDHGCMVASDGYIAVMLNRQYPEDYEGKVLFKSGEFYKIEYSKLEEDGKRHMAKTETTYVEDGREHRIYPDVRSIIPKPDDYVAYKVDESKFYEWVSEKRVQAKAETGKGSKWSPLWRVKIGPAQLKAENFDKMLTAMKEIGTDEVMVRDVRKPSFAKTEKGLVMLMPLVGEDISDNIIVLA